jgi:hypothetical protein
MRGGRSVGSAPSMSTASAPQIPFEALALAARVG